MLVGKVQLSKLLEVKLRGFVVGSRCFFDGFEPAKMDTMIIHSYAGLPALFPFVPRHASIARGVVGVDLLPTRVFLSGDDAEICPSIVEPVAVDVIDNVALGRMAYDGMVQTKETSSIGFSVAAHKMNAPFVLIKFIVHIIVHDCLEALRKFDFFCHLILPSYERLIDDGISQKVAL